jgi:hypothetical protein
MLIGKSQLCFEGSQGHLVHGQALLKDFAKEHGIIIQKT